ncbi:Phytanoyl-CoA dioxygenase [Balamuthia mandrillaris]
MDQQQEQTQQLLQKLTPEHLAAWDRDGFLVIPREQLWTEEQVKEIVQWTTDVGNWPETPGKWMMYFSKSLKDGSRLLHRIENFFDYHPEFMELFNSPRFLGFVSQLFGERALLYKEKINFKYPGGEGFEPHQDHAAGWWLYGHTLHITALVTVDKATAANGALEVVAGRHKEGLLGGKFEAVPKEEVEKMTWILTETNPGDLVFFDSFVPHRSAPNLSEESRRVLYVTYNKASEGDYRVQYYQDKRKNYPPDCEREEGKSYEYKI